MSGFANAIEMRVPWFRLPKRCPQCKRWSRRIVNKRTVGRPCLCECCPAPEASFGPACFACCRVWGKGLMDGFKMSEQLEAHK